MKNEVRRISAYGVVIAENSVLLSLLNRGPNAGKWNLVGGALEFGEAPETTLIREIKEESGICLASTPKLLSVLSDFYSYINDNNQREDFQIIGIIYSAELNEKLKCKEDFDGDSSSGCRWFKINELKEFETVPFVRQSLNKLGLI